MDTLSLRTEVRGAGVSVIVAGLGTRRVDTSLVRIAGVIRARVPIVTIKIGPYAITGNADLIHGAQAGVETGFLIKRTVHTCTGLT